VELKLNGETLMLDHGYHCRLIVSGKLCHYRVKWIESIEITGVAIVASKDDHAYRLEGLASV
jgi:DMSO/TMAO reductase YedYZ molybdopterin-dependent catalytic subunit